VELATRPRARRKGETPGELGAQRRRWLAALLVCVAVAIVLASAALFVWPKTDQPGPADALVVLGPGLGGERLTRALELTRERLAPVIVVSGSRQPARWPLEHELCATARAICFRARPFTTRGEARIVARLAREHGWRSLVIVTSTYHVTRVRLLYDRCFDGRILVVAAEPPGGLAARVRTMLHEWGGLADTLLRSRSC
jgi:uncharacterized SAM-binding protein YcdF (DUF218 family)